MIAGLSRPFRPLRRASVPPRPAGLWSLRYAGPALAAAVWVLAVVGPRRGGITPAFLLATTAVLVALTLVDLTAPRGVAAWWRRPLWLGIELALCFALVEIHGTLVRPSLIYLLPAGRAMLMFGGGAGIAWSLSVWVAYGVNIGLDAWPARLGEYPNYFSFFLAPYVLIIVLTRATLRQEADRRRLQALYDALQAAHAELQQLHRQAREAAATAERNRLAREIHDSLAHYLTVVNVQLEAAEKLTAAEPARALEQVQRARRLTLASLQEVRRSVAALRSARPEDLALPAALRRLTDEFAGSTGMAVRLAVDLGADPRLSPEVALALYRVAQEGLTNVYRHAGAASVDLRLYRDGNDLRLTVEDDGGGPVGDESDAAGFGLLGLRERVALLGGRLEFDHADPHGARLAVTIPLDGGG